MSGVHDDLATLREFVGTHDDPYDGDTSGVFALRRVEAEIARLEERELTNAVLVAGLKHRADAAEAALDDLRDEYMADAGLRTAAEARCARLQQAIAKLDDPEAIERDWEVVSAEALAELRALAGLDTENVDTTTD